MAETTQSIDGIIEKLALVADGLQTLFPDGNMAVAMELKYDDYKKVQKTSEMLIEILLNLKLICRVLNLCFC